MRKRPPLTKKLRPAIKQAYGQYEGDSGDVGCGLGRCWKKYRRVVQDLPWSESSVNQELRLRQVTDVLW